VALITCPLVDSRAQQTEAAQFGKLFEQLDSNRDQVVGVDEVPEAGKAAFQKLLANGDKNRNGKLEAEEFRVLIQKTARALALGGIPRQRFNTLDKNADGKLSKEEFTGPPKRFAQLDADRDGFISAREARGPAASTPGRTTAPRLKALDKNSDGKISREEFPGPARRFDRLDTDKNGALTPAELRAAAAARTEKK
jgi:Ca2+-binding EF-hand superfamily protein